MPRSRVGWRPTVAADPDNAPHLSAVFPTRTRPISRAHPIRDERGRFTFGLPGQRFAADVREAQAGYRQAAISGGPRFGVFRGRLTARDIAIRKGQEVPLDVRQTEAIIQGLSERGKLELYHRLIVTSPVDTGLLRSQWRITANGVANRVYYVPQTEYVNRSSRGYIRRAIRLTLNNLRNARPSRFDRVHIVRLYPSVR